MSDQQEFGWLDEVLDYDLWNEAFNASRQYGASRYGSRKLMALATAKAAIIERFTAQEEVAEILCGNAGDNIYLTFKGGCRTTLTYKDCYRCTGCGGRFHKKCILEHFKFEEAHDWGRQEERDKQAKQHQAELLRACKEATEANNDLHKRHEDNLTVVHRIELLRARIDEIEYPASVRAYEAGLGALEYESFLTKEERARSKDLQAELDKLEGERDE